MATFWFAQMIHWETDYIKAVHSRYFQQPKVLLHSRLICCWRTRRPRVWGKAKLRDSFSLIPPEECKRDALTSYVIKEIVHVSKTVKLSSREVESLEFYCWRGSRPWYERITSHGRQRRSCVKLTLLHVWSLAIQYALLTWKRYYSFRNQTKSIFSSKCIDLWWLLCLVYYQKA